jgi:hypothetical protein
VKGEEGGEPRGEGEKKEDWGCREGEGEEEEEVEPDWDFTTLLNTGVVVLG